MRAPEALLLDIATATQHISAYIEGMTHEAFVADNKTKAAVVREIEVIGEVAHRLPMTYGDGHPEVPWDELSRLRNLYIHVYERISYDRVWHTANRTVPAVALAIAGLIPPDPGDV